MKLYLRFLLAAFMLLLYSASIFSGCNSSTDPDNPDGGGNNNPSVPEGKITWKVDGETVIIDGLALYNPGDNVISVGGTWNGQGPMVQMNLAVYNPGPGDFPIRSGNSTEDSTSFATGNHHGASFAAVKSSGKVTFTSYTNQRVIGRFNFRAISSANPTDTIEITDGEFNLGRLR